MEALSILRKECIIFTTIDVIHEYGVQAVSTKEIARRLSISEGTIFRYFPKKNDLLRAIMDHFSAYDHDIIQTARVHRMKPVNAILFYIDSYAAYYENYPAITAITQAYDVLRRIPDLKDKVESILQLREEFIKHQLERAQREGDISRDADREILADIVNSTTIGICLKWRMTNNSFSLRSYMKEAVSTLLHAFTQER